MHILITFHSYNDKTAFIKENSFSQSEIIGETEGSIIISNDGTEYSKNIHVYSVKFLHPSYITEKDFPFPVKIFHAATGHIYVRPVSNLKPFSEDQELEIVSLLAKLEIKTIKQRTLANYTSAEIPAGYGFRLY